MILKVHLVFQGTCEAALNFYKETLKGEITFLFRKKEDESMEVVDAEKDKISHMVINTKHFELAGDDVDKDGGLVIGNNNKLVLSFHDLQECKRVFTAFATNGTVIMPLQKVPFSEAMGEVKDNYGISWIIIMSGEGC